MKITYYAKSLNVTNGMKSAVEKSLSSLDKYFAKEPDIKVTFNTFRNQQKVEIMVLANKTHFRVEESAPSMYEAISKAGDILERKVRKYKNKLNDKYQKAETIRIPVPDDTVGEDAPKISKSKKFEAQVMSVENAVDEMELLGHNFFLFINAETSNPAVIYKRDAGDYGIIEMV